MRLNAHALVIGVSQYQHVQRLPRVDDADDLAAVLRDPAACGYEPGNVAVLQERDENVTLGIDRLVRTLHKPARAESPVVASAERWGRP